MKTRRWMPIPLLVAAGLATVGCTVVKPVAGALVFPFASIAEAMEEKDDESGEGRFAHTPLVLAIPAAIVAVPVLVAGLSVAGAAGGLTSGFASDLNLLLGHADMDGTMESLRYPFRTNVKRKDD